MVVASPEPSCGMWVQTIHSILNIIASKALKWAFNYYDSIIRGGVSVSEPRRGLAEATGEQRLRRTAEGPESHRREKVYSL